MKKRLLRYLGIFCASTAMLVSLSSCSGNVANSVKKDAALTKGADIRIMSYNVLAELWNDQLPIEGRDVIVGDAINILSPDVIGLQELSENWYKALTPLIESSYVFVNQTISTGESNFTGLAYNREKVKLIRDSCESFYHGESNLRLMNWGLFEKLDSGKRFIVMSTHWSPFSDEAAKEYRMAQASEMALKIKDLYVQYNCPVIAVGDFNCGKKDDEFKMYKNLFPIKDAQTDADVRKNALFYTGHLMGIIPPPYDNSIDHITYTHGVHALYYKNFISAPFLKASDHSPILCDFSFE